MMPAALAELKLIGEQHGIQDEIDAWQQRWVVECGTQYAITKQEADHIQGIKPAETEKYWSYRKEACIRELVKHLIDRGGLVTEEIRKPDPGGEVRSWRINIVRKDPA